MIIISHTKAPRHEEKSGNILYCHKTTYGVGSMGIRVAYTDSG